MGVWGKWVEKFSEKVLNSAEYFYYANFKIIECRKLKVQIRKHRQYHCHPKIVNRRVTQKCSRNG